MVSFLRWAGSKRTLIPQLRAAVEAAPFERYLEPFAGSAALFFALTPRRAILADINRELIDTYRALQADVEIVLECFARIPRGERAYYQLRQSDVSREPSAVRAARFLYLNRYCFNGLYRTNSRGAFNVPYGPPRRPLAGFDERLRACAKQLQGVQLLSVDFEDIIDRVTDGDLIYMDPPYAVDEKRVFREYLPGSFSRLDLPRLTTALTRIHERGARFLLSYAASKESRLLADQWHHVVVQTRRNVAGFADHRRVAAEVLISNHAIIL